ncbi:D-alanine--D-alanine ligase, partial [Paenibacillus sp. TAF43_2]|uniref:ATP-binding protein n=1 Tax=Paenibacillus sp. TAF43_2 TaxID=3233069 RepID=UPI003F9C84BF
MRVGVIMGGISSEKEVSLMTGREMIANLDREKYELYPIEINRKDELIEKVKNIDVALLALHGKYGEDGTIQGALETLGVPYTGCGVLSSSLSMDKNISKKLFLNEGIETPDWIHLNSAAELCIEDVERLGYPVIVKPNSGGSSLGVKIIKNKETLVDEVLETFRWDNEV